MRKYFFRRRLQSFNSLTRTLHLYTVLFVSPFVVIFALSVFVVAHAAMPWGGKDAPEEVRQVNFTAPDIEDNLVFAKEVQRRLGLRGEVDYVRRPKEGDLITFPIRGPGLTTTVRLDTVANTATISTQKTGFWDAVVYLHMKPGPHNVAMQGNSPPMRLWAWLADTTIYLLLFSTASGIYLWLLLRAERKAGLAYLGVGALSFAASVLGVSL